MRAHRTVPTNDGGLALGQAQAARVWERRPLQQRHIDPGNEYYRKKRQLKAGAQQRARVYHQNAERRRSDRIHHAAFPVEQARTQVERKHERGSPHRRPHARHKCISERDDHGRNSGQRRVEPELPQRPENNERQDAQVHS